MDDEGAERAEDVGVVDEAHRLRFTSYAVQVDVDALQVDALDGHRLVQWNAPRLVHRRAYSVPDLVHQPVVRRYQGVAPPLVVLRIGGVHGG